MAQRTDIVSRGERVVVKVQIEVPASDIRRQYAPGQKAKGPFIARLLHEHAVREETRAERQREKMVGTEIPR